MAPLIRRKPIIMNGDRRMEHDLWRLKAEGQYEHLANTIPANDPDRIEILSKAHYAAATGKVNSN